MRRGKEERWVREKDDRKRNGGEEREHTVPLFDSKFCQPPDLFWEVGLH